MVEIDQDLGDLEPEELLEETVGCAILVGEKEATGSKDTEKKNELRMLESEMRSRLTAN